MIPLRDNIHSRAFPVMTVLIIAANCFFFYHEMKLSDPALTRFIAHYGLIPATFLAKLFKHPALLNNYTPLISNLFLHGGWMHIIGNMWYLWFFGDHVEDCLGSLNYLFFFLLCGVAANLAQIVVEPHSITPTIGASGAISGILGAYLILYPRARISLLIPLFLFFPIIKVRAWIFLIFWFLLQLQSGTQTVLMSGTNVAWWAHIGGFLAGMVLVKIIKE